MAQHPGLPHLRRCIELAEEALLAGDDPFGSVLVDAASGKVLAEDRNRIVTGRKGDMKADATLHPEIELARWAQENLGPEQRRETIMYTSGEHCPMCSTAHAYCGLGKIVYVSSTTQYTAWREEFGVSKSGTTPLGISQVAPNIPIEGPIPGLDQEVKELHRRRWLG